MRSSLGMFGYHVIWEMARPTLVGTAVGVAMLWLFYSVVKTNWPVSYASLGDGDYGVVVNRGAPRYFIFAIAPVYFVALIVSTTVDRQNGHAMTCAVGIGLLHVARTQLWFILKTLRRDRTRLRYPNVLFAIVLSTGVLVTSFLAGLGPGPAGVVVPQPPEFFSAFWTTAFVALLAAFVLRASKSTFSTAKALDRSRAEVGKALILQARLTARDHGTDELLVLSILYTENLQRPPWFRRLERVKAKLVPEGTYGVMQVSSDKPITDGESIYLAVSRHLKGAKVRYNEYGPVDDSLRANLRSYNDDRNFVQLASDIYWELNRQREDAGTVISQPTAETRTL